jgi:hypothetical protein
MATKTNLQVVGTKDAPAETVLSPARAALRDAISLRGGLQAEAATVEAAQRRLASLIAAERQAAKAVAALEASLAERALRWARFSEQEDPPSLANGGDLIGARETLVAAQTQAAAARMAEPRLQGEMEAVQTRRTALEDRIKAHALDVLGEIASETGEKIAALEAEIAAQCARLAAMRRPAARLAPDAVAGKRAVNALNVMIRERSYPEPEALILERRFQALAAELVGGDAGATLQIT